MNAKKPTIEQDRAAYLVLERKRVEIVEQQEAIKARIRGALKVGMSLPFGDDGKVALSPNRRFDPTLAAAVLKRHLDAGRLSAAEVEGCYDSVPVSSKVKRILGEDAYEECMKDAGNARVTIA